MRSELKFVSDLSIFECEQPYELFGYPTLDSDKITNCEYSIINDVLIEDMRCSSSVDFDLKTTGFQFIRHNSQVPLKAEFFETAGDDPRNVQVTKYLEETMALLKEHLGAEKVVCFDWRFRRSGRAEDASKAPQDVLNVRHQALPPGLTMHCDFSYDGGRDRLEMHLLEDELFAVDQGRLKAQIVNAWRPFAVVQNAPLVVSDRRTVLREDLLEVDKVLPDKVEKAYYVKYRPYHRWYFLSDQTPQDLALFKTWDSTYDSKIATFPPHGAAMHFSAGHTRPRESLEVRMIILNKEDEVVLA